MTIYRLPVAGAALPPPLACIDFDPVTGKRVQERCRSQWKEYKGKSFNCPNRGQAQGRCTKAAFLYPRKRRSNGVDFHFHQGVDIGRKAGADIYSVTNGRVVHVQRTYRRGWDFYGKLVVVKADGLPYWFLYAHCNSVEPDLVEGTIVREGQKIATVGNTFYSKDKPLGTFESSKPHLHFEVLTSMEPGVRRRETQLGEDKTATGGRGQPRLDPLYILEQLGPWGMTEVPSPRGESIDADEAGRQLREVESSPHGGYFPLGANNHWHGGVHLATAEGSTVVAPFDATIVAARLDSDPAHAIGADGSTNFILLRHELPPTYYQLFKGEDPGQIEPTPGATTTTKDRAVGTKSRCANEPDDVVQVKHKLHEHADDSGQPYYDPVDLADLDLGVVAKALKEAIQAFQRGEVPEINADGVVDIPGRTWSALHDGAPPELPVPEPGEAPPPKPVEPPVDPERVVYSLLMHLQPAAIDKALAKAFPWITQVALEPDPGSPDPAQEEALRARQRREEDLAEAAHPLSGAVGAPNGAGAAAANDPADVEWVAKRLIRFGCHEAAPSTVCDEVLIAAIREFQNDHHSAFKSKRNGDGRVDTVGQTQTLLHKTHDELLGGRSGPGTVDPVFVQRTTVRDEHGIARVISGLNVKVRSGDPLWRSSVARGYSADGQSLQMIEQVHWEIFSEHLLVSGWEDPIDDDTDDLTADVPQRWMDFLESGSPPDEQDGILTVDEVRRVYQDGRGELLRRTPCRFVSQWALDVDKAVSRLATMGFDTDGLADRLRPLMWWDQANDVLPATRFVWHYNPIEFLAQYSEYLETLKPRNVDPATHPTVVVRVLYDNREPMAGVDVQLLYGIEIRRTVKTNSDGEARFVGVEVGEYGVRVAEPATTPLAVDVRPNETRQVEIVTDVVGPPPPRGTIDVIVRKHTKTIAGDDIDVWLSTAAGDPLLGDSTRKGKVSFEALLFGEYSIQAGEADPLPVTLDKKKRKQTVVLPPPPGVLRVKLRIDRAPGRGQTMEVHKDGETVASMVTNDEGVAAFELLEGRYKVWVGDNKKGVYVEGYSEREYTMKLSEQDAPTPIPEPEELEGVLAVSVSSYEDDEPIADEVVFVVGADGVALSSRYTNEYGIASFELPPGDYVVEAANESTNATVDAWSAVEVELAVDQ